MAFSFNSRTPGGVRPGDSLAPRDLLHVSIHAPREGCDTIGELRYLLSRSFNSRTPGGVRLGGRYGGVERVGVSIHAPREGCDHLKHSVATAPSSFNSRTPGGVRLAITLFVDYVDMFQFTHPGRGATGLQFQSISRGQVSIHAPREGCDFPLRVGTTHGLSFNSRTPGGVRHWTVRGEIARPKFQFTHPGRGATVSQMIFIFDTTFQFTHPGRGATIVLT